jgi:hypothetical protein
MKTFIKKNFTYVLFLLCFVPSVSLAAELFFTAEQDIFFQKEKFLTQVFLDTENVTINALEGTVMFPPELLELKEIRNGNSIVNFWIEKPHQVVNGKISFSGITTGGFSGPKIFLFSMVFQSKKVDNGAITFNNMNIRQNDGMGTKISIQTTPFTFSISKEVLPTVKTNISVVEDNDIPESFNPLIGNDSAIFDGKYFLVFTTQDKGSGIDHYEIIEGKNEIVVAESPFLLKNQELDEKILVKAFDKNGNERVEIIYPPNWHPWYKNYLIFGILIISVLIVFYTTKKFYGKNL